MSCPCSPLEPGAARLSMAWRNPACPCACHSSMILVVCLPLRLSQSTNQSPHPYPARAPIGPQPVSPSAPAAPHHPSIHLSPVPFSTPCTSAPKASSPLPPTSPLGYSNAAHLDARPQPRSLLTLSAHPRCAVTRSLSCCSTGCAYGSLGRTVWSTWPRATPSSCAAASARRRLPPLPLFWRRCACGACTPQRCGPSRPCGASCWCLASRRRRCVHGPVLCLGLGRAYAPLGMLGCIVVQCMHARVHARAIPQLMHGDVRGCSCACTRR